MPKKLAPFLLMSVCCANQGWSPYRPQAMQLVKHSSVQHSTSNGSRTYVLRPDKQPHFCQRHRGKIAVGACVATGVTVAAATAPLWVPLLAGAGPTTVLANATIVNATTAMAAGTSTAMTAGSTASTVGTMASVTMTALPTAGLIASLLPTPKPTPLEIEATTTSTSTTTTPQLPTVKKDEYGVHVDNYMIGLDIWQDLKRESKGKSEKDIEKALQKEFGLHMEDSVLQAFVREICEELGKDAVSVAKDKTTHKKESRGRHTKKKSGSSSKKTKKKKRH